MLLDDDVLVTFSGGILTRPFSDYFGNSNLGKSDFGESFLYHHWMVKLAAAASPVIRKNIPEIGYEPLLRWGRSAGGLVYTKDVLRVLLRSDCK